MPKRFIRAAFNADPNVGLYGFATDSYCLLGIEPKKKVLQSVKRVLKVPINISSIAGTDLVGIFAAGNSNGIILPKIIEKHELAKIKKLGINVLVLKTKETAMGNLIVCNDNGCLISNFLKRYRKKIADCLGVDTKTGTVAGLEIVGSSAIASNKGCLCHSGAEEKEMDAIEELLKAKVDLGTVSFGSPFVHSGLLVNSKGIVVSQTCTGPELGRVAEVFLE